MPTPTPLITAQNLVDALSLPTYMALFDDANTGNRSTVDASTGVALVLSRSHVQVESWLPDIFKTMPTSTPVPSQLLVDAELQFAVIYSYRRHPEYVKTYGAEPNGSLWKEALAFMYRIQAGTQLIPPDDNPPETAPENVGGSTIADGPRIAITSNDGSTPNTGDW